MAQNKSGGIFGSLIGMLIGLGLVIILSPYLLWQAHSQHRAEDFASAEQVEATSDVEGYVVVEETGVPLEKLACPRPGDNFVSDEGPADADKEEATNEDEEEFEEESADEPDELERALEEAGYEFEDVEDATEKEKTDETKEVVEDKAETDRVTAEQMEPRDCLYVSEQEEVYSRSEEEVCGRVNKDQTIIRELGQECDDDGNCEQCYLVESFDWERGESLSEYSSFTLGSYEVTPSGKAKFIGTKSLLDYQYPSRKSSPKIGDKRFDYTYLLANEPTLVVGNASGQNIEGALDDKIYVVSSKSYAGTLEALQDQDEAASKLLWILSLLAMIVGMLLVVGPLTLLTDVFKAIPVIGKHADQGFDGVIKFAAMVVGLVLWLIIYAFVLIAKNILIILAVLAVIGIGVFLLATKGKLKLKKS